MWSILKLEGLSLTFWLWRRYETLRRKIITELLNYGGVSRAAPGFARAPLITAPPLISFTTLSEKKIVTCDM